MSAPPLLLDHVQVWFMTFAAQVLKNIFFQQPLQETARVLQTTWCSLEAELRRVGGNSLRSLCFSFCLKHSLHIPQASFFFFFFFKRLDKFASSFFKPEEVLEEVVY